MVEIGGVQANRFADGIVEMHGAATRHRKAAANSQQHTAAGEVVGDLHEQLAAEQAIGVLAKELNMGFGKPI